MDQATPRAEVRTARHLQKVRVQSWEARRLAVRRSSQDPRGTQTAGLDGVPSLTSAGRWRLAQALRLEGQAPPRRRLGIPKRGRAAKRPRGMPTHQARARHTLVRQALEPAWDAKRAPHPSGLRPGRSCHEAIGAPLQRYPVSAALRAHARDRARLRPPRSSGSGGQNADGTCQASATQRLAQSGHPGRGSPRAPHRRAATRRQVCAALSRAGPAWHG